MDTEHYRFDSFLEFSKRRSSYKDAKNKEYLDGKILQNKHTNQLISLNYDKFKQVRFSLIQNHINSFVRVMRDKDRVMIFATLTHKPKYHIKENSVYTIQETLKNQKNKFTLFHRSLSRDRHFDFYYYRVLELTKKGNIHSHSIDFVTDDLYSILEYVDLYDRKKKSADLGRIELRLPKKYKDLLIHSLSLNRLKNGSYYQKKDSALLKNGNIIIFTFFNEDDTEKNVSAYIAKYALKNINSKNPSNEYYIFRELGIRAYTYSLILPSLTAYQKIRSQLIAFNPKFSDLYELYKYISTGKAELLTFYDPVDKSFETRTIKYDKIYFQNDIPAYIQQFQTLLYKKKAQYILKHVVFHDYESDKLLIWHSGDWQPYEDPNIGAPGQYVSADHPLSSQLVQT